MSKRKHMPVQQEVTTKAVGSTFGQYIATAVGCVLIAAIGLTFTMFATDTIGVPTSSTIANSQEIDIPRSYSVSVRDIEREKEKTNLEEVGNGSEDNSQTPPIIGIDPDEYIDPGENTPSAPIEISADAQQIYDKLVNSEFADKAKSLSVCWDVVHDNFNSTDVNADAMAIGLMANIIAEGNYGVIEHAFSLSHAGGFSLPSGGATMVTIADIQYAKSWDSTSSTKVSYTTSRGGTKTVKLGSCGAGSIQWSFSRRVGLLDKALSIMSSDSDVNEENWIAVEANFIADELSPSGRYMQDIRDYLSNKGATVENATPEQWAAAIQVKYERPGHSDTSDRENNATRLYALLQ